jgi:hypothetical protein
MRAHDGIPLTSGFSDELDARKNVGCGYSRDERRMLEPWVGWLYNSLELWESVLRTWLFRTWIHIGKWSTVHIGYAPSCSDHALSCDLLPGHGLSNSPSSVESIESLT